jgi:hypothetical protein
MTCAVTWSGERKPKGQRKPGASEESRDVSCAGCPTSHLKRLRAQRLLPHVAVFQPTSRMQEGAGTRVCRAFVRSFVSGPSRPDTHPQAPKRRAWEALTGSAGRGEMPENLAFPSRSRTSEPPTPYIPGRHTRQHIGHIHCTSTASATHALDSRSGSSISRRARCHHGHITRPTSHKLPPCSSPIRHHHAHTRMVAAMRQPQPLSGELSLTFPRAFLELVHQPAIQQLYSFQRRLSVARTHALSRGDWRAVL